MRRTEGTAGGKSLRKEKGGGNNLEGKIPLEGRKSPFGRMEGLLKRMEGIFGGMECIFGGMEGILGRIKIAIFSKLKLIPHKVTNVK